jgi:peptide/nickel transport system ATP-binding protein
MSLEIAGLTAVTRQSGVPVLRGVSLTVGPGESHGLMGESGAGKSTLGKALLGLLPDAIRITGGTIALDGRDLGRLPVRERARAGIALIPQDPMVAMNPARRAGDQLADGMRLLLGLSRAEAAARALRLLEEVRIRDPEAVMRRYPHELSGGMRQRILIAAALSLEPRLLVADEPTTALDVTVQKEILRLIRGIQRARQLSVLFVSHDLGVVAQVCDRVTILWGGKVMEQGAVGEVLARPRHPYTQALIAASPRHDRPEEALHPVPEAVTAALRAEVAAWDRAHD